MTQRERLEAVLRDGMPHRSDELAVQVYGDNVRLARLAARVWDVKKRLGPELELRGWKDKTIPALYWYQVRPARATATQGVLDLQSGR